MQRYFINQKNIHFPEVVIDRDDNHHIQKVMRMSVGDECLCAVSGNAVYRCRIIKLEERQTMLEIIETISESNELPVHIAIAQGLPKGDKMEWILQKGTECGAAEFIPYTAERSVVKWTESKWSKKAERFNKIIKEAAEQSHRSLQPELQAVHSHKQLLDYSNQFDFKVIAYEETAKLGQQNGLAKVFSQMKRDSSLILLIGPEGGFSAEEVTKFNDHGFECCALGQRILRTETAAVYALAAASYHFELLNGVT